MCGYGLLVRQNEDYEFVLGGNQRIYHLIDELKGKLTVNNVTITAMLAIASFRKVTEYVS